MASLFLATLRIRTSVKEPTLIDQALERTSTGFSPVILLDSQMRRLPCEHNYWKLRIGGDSGEEDLTALLEEFIVLMESSGKRLNRVALYIDKIDIICMVSSENGQGSICIKSEIMARLVNLDIDLVFDIYIS